MIKYEGTFNNNLRDGIGSLHYENGDSFFGEFKNGYAEGFGVYY